jgi:hypothetical protein
MIRLQEIVGLPTLQYHLDNKLTLSECIYRYSSDSFVQLFSEARQALRDGKITLNESDLDLIKNTDIGEYGLFEGEKVPLDLPMVYEEDLNKTNIAEYTEYEDKVTPLDKPFRYTDEVKVNMLVTGPDNVTYRIIDIEGDSYYLKPRSGQEPTVIFPEDFVATTQPVDFWDYFVLEKIMEAEYRGKNVQLNKPKRGGPKKFYVYVKNPKTGNIKKVNFGDSGNLSVKINEPGARTSFAARHQCDKKKDRTSPGYWSCNIGRYWKSLGGNRNFSGYW